MASFLTLPIDAVQSGMVFGESIPDETGRNLVEAGSVANQYEIHQLKKLGVRNVLIRIGRAGAPQDAISANEGAVVSPRAARQIALLRKPDPARVELTASVKQRINDGIQMIYTNPDPKLLAGTATAITNDLMAAIESNNAVALNINDLKTSDEYTFKHSVDVATIAMIIARNRGYQRQQVYEIGEAGLLHDIGKTKVPPEILNKPGRLTDEEFRIMKRHSAYSFVMIARNREISRDVKFAVLQHHEKIDGTGYPDHLEGDQIHPYARILAVSDIYDALVTDRPYKKGYSPREAVELMMTMTSQLDMDDFNSFLSTMILYPVDSIVHLSNGETARVVKKSDSLILRPTVVNIRTGEVYNLESARYANIVIT